MYIFLKFFDRTRIKLFFFFQFEAKKYNSKITGLDFFNRTIASNSKMIRLVVIIIHNLVGEF